MSGGGTIIAIRILLLKNNGRGKKLENKKNRKGHGWRSRESLVADEEGIEGRGIETDCLVGVHLAPAMQEGKGGGRGLCDLVRERKQTGNVEVAVLERLHATQGRWRNHLRGDRTQMTAVTIVQLLEAGHMETRLPRKAMQGQVGGHGDVVAECKAVEVSGRGESDITRQRRRAERGV